MHMKILADYSLHHLHLMFKVYNDVIIRDGCDATSCGNIVENCIDDDEDVNQGAYTLICKYGVIGLACVNMLREVCG